MNLQRRWEFLRKAMRRVVVYDVPNGAHVGVITFNSAGRTVAPLSFIDSEDSDMRQRVGSSLPRNPSAVRESQKCILCGLQQVLKVLGKNKKFGRDAIVILITTGSSPTSEEDVANMISLTEQNNLRTEVVLYPVTEHRSTAPTYHGLEALVEATRGSIFTVMDEGVGNDSKLKMMVALMDALLAAVQSSVPPSSPGGPVLVHSADYPGGIASISAGTFALDDSLGLDARFSVYYYDLNHVGNAIRLTAPSGHMIASVNVQEEDGDVNMIFINLGKEERGRWKYSVENSADSHQGLYVQVTARRNTSTGLAVRLWTSSGTRFLNYSDPTSAVVVFMEVREGVAPVMDARVVATLQRLGTNETGSNYEPVLLNLWDNGAGDPDITRGDGVYSRYLPRLAGGPGRYLLSATVDHNEGQAVVAQGPPSRPRVPLPPHHLPHYFHQPELGTWGDAGTCCGSSLFYFHSRTAPPFQRHLTFGVLEVLSSPNQRDLTPPSRILDLRVEVNDTVHEIFLRWTAPGDDWDVGSAHHYQAVVAPQWKEARAFQGDTLTGLPRPLPAGKLHTTNLHFIRYEELWYVSMRAVDAAGNKGPLGNIAALWVPRPPTTYEITTRTHPSLTTLGNYAMPSELGSGRPLGMTELRAEDVAVIVGSLVGFLVVATTLASYCYYHTFRRRKQSGKHEDVKTVVHGDNGSNSSGNADVSLAIKTESAVNEGARGSHESIHSSANDNTSRKPLDVVSHSSGQSWGTANLPRENGADMPGEPLATFSSLDGRPPFPDVTVTDYQASSGGGQTSLHMPYVHEKAADHYEVPSLAYSSYNAGWEEPLTSHLLSQVHTPAPTPAPQQFSLPQADRKRRNVTQV
ncbi:Calcium-activated chloride channel regulator 2 [Portunus trituberculatus]|uniref:Calcium-activated chloride channel regulator 2 n=1 Tax=Portunus trituberculatus TaxID=210409 RepID=A0A5B7E576_PORTR|nr:Calcium-activated chloride channel regulator 2 [Portunus trituberculatus]